jgi:hypothetical protein
MRGCCDSPIRRREFARFCIDVRESRIFGYGKWILKRFKDLEKVEESRER